MNKMAKMFKSVIAISTLSLFFLPAFSATDTGLPVNFVTKENTLHFYYHDSVGYGHPVLVKKGETKMFITSPVLLFEANDNQTPYLVKPGETIVITKNADNFLALSIANNTERNGELLFYKELVKQTGKIYDGGVPQPYHGHASTRVEFNERIAWIEKRKNERLVFLDSFSNKIKLNTGFKKNARNIILSTAIKDWVMLYRNNTDLDNKQANENSLLYRCITELNKIEYSPFMPYLHACLQAVNANFEKSTLFDIRDGTDLMQKYDFILKNFTQMARNFLLARCLYTAAVNNVKIPELYVNKFRTDCLDKGYQKIVNEKINERQTFITGKQQNKLINIHGALKDIQAILADNSNTVLFIDFWASWCAPCRNEMPESRKLEKVYEGKKIRFLYFSTDKNLGDWKKANKEEKLNEANSFLIMDPENSKIIKQNKISSIPRYILIGKNKSTIISDAPRPSDPKLKILLNRLLAE